MIRIFLLLAVLCAAVLPLAAQQLQGQYRGFWVDAVAGHAGLKTPQQVDQLIADARRAGANVLFVQVRRRGGSLFLRSLEPPYLDPSYSPDFDALQDVIDKAHAAGIEVHAWLNIGPLGGDAEARDSRHVLAQHGKDAPGRANWLSLSNLGNSYTQSNYFIDHGHPDAVAYTADVVQHVVRNYAVDGIHFDYIRYAETSGGEYWGYNPASVERFNRLYLRTGQPAVNDPDWAEFRRQQVTALVRKMYLRAVGFRREVRVSGALISWGDAPAVDGSAWNGSAAYSTVFQNWREWLREGILDFGVPMNYDRDHDANQKLWFDRWVAFERQNQGRRAIVTGMAAYLNTIQGSLAQASRVLTAPAGAPALAGANFFSYAVTDTRVNSGQPVSLNQEFYAALGDFYASMGPATAPVLPWKVAPTTGHLLGEVLVDGESRSPLADGIRMVAQGPGGTLTTTVDGTGAFGFVEAQPGTYTLTGYRGTTVVVPAASVGIVAGSVATVSVPITRAAMAAAITAVNRDGVTNAATYSAAAVAQGSLISIFGTQLTETTAAATSLPLPRSLGGTQVLVNGIIAPLLYVSPLQINAQAPFGLAGGEATVVIRRNGVEGPVMNLPLAEAAPGLFNVAQKADYSLVSATNAAARGTIVLLYGTGFGAVTGNVVTGAAASALPLATPVQVTVGGVAATVHYAGLAPGFAGLYQLNVEIPATAVPGNSVPVQITIAGRSSNVITVSVR